MAIKLKNGETILFIGDSITDCGRRGQDRPLGSGYVKLFRDLLMLREPAKAARVTVINKGIGGETIIELRNRWTDDVFRHKPDWLSVKIGINDLHRTLGGSPNAVPPDLYEAAYDEVLTRTRKRLPRVKLLLIEPFYISSETSSESRRHAVLKMLPRYARVVRKMARKHRARLIKTHEVYQKLLKHHEAETFCPEPVHPNVSGHLVIAEEVYRALSR